MSCAKSTFTLCTAGIMRPLLVKKRETSSPLSARLPIDSAEAGFLRLRVFFIKRSLLFCCSPECDQALVFTLFVLTDFKDDREQLPFHPPNCPILLRHICCVSA